MAQKTYDIFDLGLDKAMNRQSGLLSFIPEDITTSVGALSLTLPSSAPISKTSAGEIPQITFVAKQSFTDTANGMRQGLDTDGTYKWIIGTTGNSVDFNVTTANTLTISGALSASTIDIGGADATSFHVDIDGNMWLGAATFAAATAFKVSNAGVLTSISGTIAAFTLAATTISATNLTITSGAANTANISVGTGSNLAGMNSGNAGTDIAFWSGNTFANRATAPFRVNLQGDVTMTSATITGSIISLSNSQKSGTFSKDVSDASTTQNIAHGLAGTPTYIKFSWLVSSGGSATAAFGTYNGTTNVALYWDMNGGTQTTGAYAIAFKNAGNEQNAVCTFDATNIILTWTKTASPTGNILVLWEVSL